MFRKHKDVQETKEMHTTDATRLEVLKFGYKMTTTYTSVEVKETVTKNQLLTVNNNNAIENAPSNNPSKRDISYAELIVKSNRNIKPSSKKIIDKPAKTQLKKPGMSSMNNMIMKQMVGGLRASPNKTVEKTLMNKTDQKP